MNKETLEDFLKENLDASEIAKRTHCSRNKVIYWLNKYKLKTPRQNSVNNNYETKLCGKCRQIKSKTEFYSGKKNKLLSYCISCKHNYYKNKRKNFKTQIVELKGGKCINCGYNKCFAALDLHHISPKEKEFSFNRSNLSLSPKILKELEKCILLCSNCHREIHNGCLKIEEVLFVTPPL